MANSFDIPLMVKIWKLYIYSKYDMRNTQTFYVLFWCNENWDIHKILLTVNRTQCHLLLIHQSSLNCSIHQTQNCNCKRYFLSSQTCPLQSQKLTHFLYHYFFLLSDLDDLKNPVVYLNKSRSLDFKMSLIFIFHLV